MTKLLEQHLKQNRTEPTRMLTCSHKHKPMIHSLTNHKLESDSSNAPQKKSIRELQDHVCMYLGSHNYKGEGQIHMIQILVWMIFKPNPVNP